MKHTPPFDECFLNFKCLNFYYNLTFFTLLLIYQPLTFKMAAKTDAQKVARLLMKHCGCHQVNIFVLSSKHKKLMENKIPYNPSHFTVCVPVVNRRSSKGLRSSDSSKKSIDLKTSLRKANKLNDPLRRTIRLYDASNPDLKSRRRELLDERPRHEKPRLSDAFLLPKECFSVSEKQSDDLRSSRLPTYKPRLSDAFLKDRLRVSECSSDADDESDFDLLRSRRVVKNPLRRTVRLSEIKKPVNLPLLTEDEELLGEKTEMKPVSLSDLAKSGRFEIKDGQLYKHSLVSKRPCVACRTVKRDPNAKVRKYSSDTDILYQDDCDCHFCSLLRHYNGCPLLFAREFISDKGHGFFTKL